MIYLDNAATTFPKPKCVLSALKDCLKHAGGNPGRSAHKPALLAAEVIYDTRESLARLLDFSYPEKIVFTQNATYALNMALNALPSRPRHLIYSDKEHNSVIRPIEAMKAFGTKSDVFSTKGDVLQNMEDKVNFETDVCIISLCSNVTGEPFPLSALQKFRERHPKIFVILDGSQWIGHFPFSLKDPICDILCAPGHKALFGIQGSGFAVFIKDLEYHPFAFGGSGNESKSPKMPALLPERMEAGTQSTPAIATLGAGARFLINEDINAVERKICLLTERIYEILKRFPNLHVLTSGGKGIVSFTADGIPSSAVAEFLDKKGICVRSGLHCAPTVHELYRTASDGTVRISVSYLNTMKELDGLFRALRDFDKIHY